jgi:spermidine synthase
MIWRTIGGRCIYHSATGIRIFENYFFRWLKFDSEALQTLLFRLAPQYAGLNYVKTLVFLAKEMPGYSCMLGLGGGGVAHALSPFIANFPLTAIEYNQEVIQVAARFFRTEKLHNLNIIHSEANKFVSTSTQQFQHVIVDLFNANSFPASCYTQEFFAHCQRILNPGGFLAVNLANRHEQRPIFEMIKKQFCGATVAIPIKNCANLVIFACNSNKISPLLNLFKNSHQLKRLTWDETWGCVAHLG